MSWECKRKKQQTDLVYIVDKILIVEMKDNELGLENLRFKFYALSANLLLCNNGQVMEFFNCL